jgi:predicted glycosyltransferase
MAPKRVLVYSHDTYGLGNIRRMLAISEHLLRKMPDLSILLVSGSPVIDRLGLPDRLDYIKLPCLTRVERGQYRPRRLEVETETILALRAELIRVTARHFAPDLLLVDKKPLGIRRELEPTLLDLSTRRPTARRVLVLRDILDRPETIIDNWERNGHAAALQVYDRILVLGQREIFDLGSEYRLTAAACERIVYCGYLRKEAPVGAREAVRHSRGIREDQKLLLVTPGGGEDGERLVETALLALGALRQLLTGQDQAPSRSWRAVIVSGPEMRREARERLRRMADDLPGVDFETFSGEMIELVAAADIIVSMGGYNTICEIVSQRKRAIVVPRVEPTEEQLLRAECLAPLGLFDVIHPDQLDPASLAKRLAELLPHTKVPPPDWGQLDLNGLPTLTREVESLLEGGEDLGVREREAGSVVG